MAFKRIVANSEEDLEKIVNHVKDWFKNSNYTTEEGTEKRKFQDPDTKEILEKDKIFSDFKEEQEKRYIELVQESDQKLADLTHKNEQKLADLTHKNEQKLVEFTQTNETIK